MSRTVLAIGAHFDDVEFGCGGSLVRHVREGDRLNIAVATHSGFAAPDGRIVRDSAEARAEGEAAAAVLGAQELLCGDFETNNLMLGDALVSFLRAAIDDLSPDVVYTHWTEDAHADHAVLARATLSAARHVPTVLMYRSNFYAAAQPFPGTVYVDISETLATKRAAAKVFVTEQARKGGDWFAEFVDRHRLDGRAVGVAHAECFAPLRLKL